MTTPRTARRRHCNPPYDLEWERENVPKRRRLLSEQLYLEKRWPEPEDFADLLVAMAALGDQQAERDLATFIRGPQREVFEAIVERNLLSYREPTDEDSRRLDTTAHCPARWRVFARLWDYEHANILGELLNNTPEFRCHRFFGMRRVQDEHEWGIQRGVPGEAPWLAIRLFEFDAMDGRTPTLIYGFLCAWRDAHPVISLITVGEDTIAYCYDDRFVEENPSIAGELWTSSIDAPVWLQQRVLIHTDRYFAVLENRPNLPRFLGAQGFFVDPTHWRAP